MAGTPFWNAGAESLQIDFREIGWDGMGWINQAQDTDHWRTLVNTIMNIRVS
jgi:hypothetical protein